MRMLETVLAPILCLTFSERDLSPLSVMTPLTDTDIPSKSISCHRRPRASPRRNPNQQARNTGGSILWCARKRCESAARVFLKSAYGKAVGVLWNARH